MKKKIIAISFILLITILILFEKNTFHKDNANHGKTMAIYYEKLGGTDYVPWEYDVYPDGYKLNEGMSICKNGSSLLWDRKNRTVKLISDRADKCTLYFDMLDQFVFSIDGVELDGSEDDTWERYVNSQSSATSGLELVVSDQHVYLVPVVPGEKIKMIKDVLADDFIEPNKNYETIYVYPDDPVEPPDEPVEPPDDDDVPY